MAVSDEARAQELLKKIATPSRMAMAISKDFAGLQWHPHPWVLYVEREVLEMLKRPGNEVLVVSVPPQEGKSTFSCMYFPSWFIGMNPDKLVILVGYNDEYISTWSVKCRNLIERFGPELFNVGLSKSQQGQSNWRTTKGFGGMLAAGILSGITGNPGHLIIIDDVIKTMEEANSPTTKRKHLGEWDGSISSRFQEDTKVLITATVWAEDDLGREIYTRSIAEQYEGLPVRWINIKAQAEPSDEERLVLTPEELAEWTDFLGRHEGEFLAGQHSETFFKRRKGSVGNYTWSTLYQGSPTSLEGSMFPREKWGWFDPANRPRLVVQRRVWDLAASEGEGDFTVGAHVGKDRDGNYYVLDVQRFQRSAEQVMASVKAQSDVDGWAVPVRIEEERAGAGKSLIAFYKAALRGRDVDHVKAEGEKVSRFMPYSVEQQNSKVFLPRNADGTSPAWVPKFIEEHRQQLYDGRGPKHDDQIDTCAYAILEMHDRQEVELVDPANMPIPDIDRIEQLAERLGMQAIWN